jgi:hypothetical protein
MAPKGHKTHVCQAHVGPKPAVAPALLDEVPLLIQLEREVEEEFREPMRARLEEKIRQVDDSLSGSVPQCCGQAMRNKGRKPSSFISRFGKIPLWPTSFRCGKCHRRVRPLVDKLGVEIGRISGSLARLLALLGVVVPYMLAARLAHLFFGVEVSAMGVWRCVQRLGETCEQHVDAQTRYHNGAHAEIEKPDCAPQAVVLGVDGCMLGMQVRERRRRRHSADEVLPDLPPVKDGHFREVKTGVLLLPSERTESSPGRRSVIRRVLVSSLGHADRVFERLWAKLQELGWLGEQTVVVIVGDGAEWIWNRATMFARRCEILDFWHAIEHAWEYARLRYGEESKAATRWISRMTKDLRAGKVDEVIARLRTLKTRCPEEREKLDNLIKYYTDNISRMRYDEYLRLGYGIGSGAVESAHKQVVHARLRQAGMRWSEAGARRLLALRILLLNDDWSMLDRLTMKPIAA